MLSPTPHWYPDDVKLSQEEKKLRNKFVSIEPSPLLKRASENK